LIGGNKMNIPKMIYGTYNHSNKTQFLVQDAFKEGVTAFDSATTHHYREESLSFALKQIDISRDKIWLQSKFSPRPAEYGPIYNTSLPLYQQVWQSLHWSLNTLNVTYLDAYIVHNKVVHRENIKENDLIIWQSMEEIYRDGYANYIGYSNLFLEDLKTLIANSTIKPSFLQNGYILYDRDKTQADILEFCLENAITYQAFSLLRNNALLADPKISNIANNHNVTNAQVLIKFVTELGMQPIIGGSSTKHVVENANLNFELENEEISEITNLTPQPERLSSIYEKLQNGSLMPLRTIVENIVGCEPSNLKNLMAQISHYIAKLDATSLTEIIFAQDSTIIGYLTQYGADCTEFTSEACAKIISSHGPVLITILKNELVIPAEKLLLATSNLVDTAYFNSLLKDANFSKLSKHTLLKIIQNKFIAHNISVESASYQLVEEISQGSTKSDGVVKLFACAEDQVCRSQCLESVPISYVGCCSEFYNANEEL